MEHHRLDCLALHRLLDEETLNDAEPCGAECGQEADPHEANLGDRREDDTESHGDERDERLGGQSVPRAAVSRRAVHVLAVGVVEHRKQHREHRCRRLDGVRERRRHLAETYVRHGVV